MFSVNIQYSPTSCLDVYHPVKKRELSPIILFIYGGSWSSGSKLIYTTFANTLRELGYIIVVPDYQKYPTVKVEGMYKDIKDAMRWVYKHANELHGDPDMIYMLVGSVALSYLHLLKFSFFFFFLGSQCWRSFSISSGIIRCY